MTYWCMRVCVTSAQKDRWVFSPFSLSLFFVPQSHVHNIVTSSPLVSSSLSSRREKKKNTVKETDKSTLFKRGDVNCTIVSGRSEQKREEVR